MNKVIVIGGKGSAVVVAEQIIDAEKRGSGVSLLGFAFDDESFGNEINGIPILGKTKEIYGMYSNDPDTYFIFQLYRPDLMVERIALRESLGIPTDRYFSFVHPLAMVARSARIGRGSAIMSGAVINANAVVGKHCSVHSGSIVGHDSQVGDSTFIAAHSVIGSNSKLGMGIFVGLNATINNYINIGDHSFIGMASNVVKGIDSGVKVYGNPAKPFEGKIKPL